jgi:drug/metabolite transporter (DMT)-like permease
MIPAGDCRLKNIKVWIYLLLANLFWAGNYIFGDHLIMEMSPLRITFSRWFLALIILFSLAYFIEKPDWKKVKKEWLLLLIMGILGIIGYNYFLLTALKFTTVTNAALVSAINPGIIVLFSILFFRERQSKLQMAGLAVSLLGVMVIITQGKWRALLQLNFNSGDLIMILVVILWSFYSIIGKKLTTPPITATAISTLFAIVILTPFIFLEGIAISEVSYFSTTGIIYMAIFPCVLSFIFWNLSVKAIGVSKTGVSLNLIPVFTAIVALLLGERITLEQILGGILVFIGVCLTSGIMNSTDKKAELPLEQQGKKVL